MDDEAAATCDLLKLKRRYESRRLDGPVIAGC